MTNNALATVKIAGFPAEIRKRWQHYEIYDGGILTRVPDSYDYEMTIRGGDAGEVLDYPFDGHLIRWQRVAIKHAFESSEYVAVSVSALAESDSLL